MSKFETILEICLERLRSGDSVAACLADYPEQAAQLQPLLTAAEALRREKPAAMNPAADRALRQQVLQASAEQKQRLPARLRRRRDTQQRENQMLTTKRVLGAIAFLVIALGAFTIWSLSRPAAVEPIAQAIEPIAPRATAVLTPAVQQTAQPTPTATAPVTTTLQLPDGTVCQDNGVDEALPFNQLPTYACDNAAGDLVTLGDVPYRQYLDYQQGRLVEEGDSRYLDGAFVSVVIDSVTLQNGQTCTFATSDALQLSEGRTLSYRCGVNDAGQAVGLLGEWQVADIWQAVEAVVDESKAEPALLQTSAVPVARVQVAERPSVSLDFAIGDTQAAVDAQFAAAGYEVDFYQTTYLSDTLEAAVYQHPRPNFAAATPETPHLLVYRATPGAEPTLIFNLQEHVDFTIFYLMNWDPLSANSKPDGWRDFNGDGLPDFAMRAGSGGNGWLTSPLVLLSPTSQGIDLLNDALALPEKFGVSLLQDLNGDGIFELLVTDARFELAFDLCHACSPSATRIYAWNGMAYEEASADFPDFYAPTIADFTAQLETAGFSPDDPFGDGLSLGGLISLLLAYENSGQAAAGWAVYAQYADPALYDAPSPSLVQAWAYFQPLFAPGS